MLFTNGLMVLPDKVVKGKSLRINEKRISEILDQGYLGEETFDLEGCYLMPGLVDIHTHGAMGSDVMDSTPEDLRNIASFQASHGVTSLVLSTLTAPLEETFECVDVIGSMMDVDTGGSRILGAHLEGPCLSENNRGAHNSDFLINPNCELLDSIFKRKNIIRQITVAPELPGMDWFIREIAESGITVAGGHDDAIDTEIQAAIDAGMTHSTHIYCVMSTVSFRDGDKYGGLIQTVLYDDHLTTEMIGDNIHVPPSIARLVYKCKGSDGLCLVSDCLKVAGLEPGHVYSIGPKKYADAFKVYLDHNVAKVPDRCLNAGSIMTLDRMLKNMILDVGIPIHDAVKMSSLTPARVVKRDKDIGSLEVGKYADLCVMDKDFTVKHVWINGERKK